MSNQSKPKFKKIPSATNPRDLLPEELRNDPERRRIMRTTINN
jgi:hypothetical protein